MKHYLLCFAISAILLCLGPVDLKAQSATYRLSLYLQGTYYGNSYPIAIFTNVFAPPNNLPVSTYFVSLDTPVDLTNYAWSSNTLNDKAASANLDAGAAGVRFTFYKNTGRDLSRGHTIVIAKQAFVGYHLRNFETSYEDDFVKVTFNQGYNGYESMDGEVSSIIMEKF